jgi:hypothetical protein
MNIRAKVNHLVDLQDNITHINNHAPPIDSDVTSLTEFRQEIGALQQLRSNLCNEIVEYVIRLEERVKELERRRNYDSV